MIVILIDLMALNKISFDYFPCYIYVSSRTRKTHFGNVLRMRLDASFRLKFQNGIEQKGEKKQHPFGI